MPVPPSPLRRVDDSMSLLVDLMQHAEDPAYADAAAGRPRTAGRRSAPRSPRRIAVGALVVAVVGGLTGTAAAAVRAGADDGAARDGLVREVHSRTAQSDALVTQANALRTQVAALRDAALAGTGGPQAGQLQGLELAAATVAVTGPGVSVLLDDRPAGGSAPTLVRGALIGSGRVLDSDLQVAVNGLWAAGAEAVSVNDLRLTARTAIRSAGAAILVDYRPLSPPYVVRAIGDPGRLEPDFADSTAGRQLAAYTSLYGLRFSVTRQDGLSLPAGVVPDPRSATPVPAPPAPSPPAPS